MLFKRILSKMNSIYSEPQFNEVPRDWRNLFVILRVHYIENFDLTNFWENEQNVHYVKV